MPDTYPTILNSYLNPQPLTIMRKGPFGPVQYLEASSSATLTPPYPGMLLQQNSDGTVSVQTTKGIDCPRFVAIEDALQGQTYNDQYSQGNIVRYVIAQPGICLQMPIPIGTTTAVGNMMMSNGDGSVTTVGSGAGTTLYVSPSNSNIVSNTNVQTSFGQTFLLGSSNIAALDVYRIFLQGEIVNKGVNTATVSYVLCANNTNIATIAAYNFATNDTFYMDVVLVANNTGATSAWRVAGVTAAGIVATDIVQPVYTDPVTLNTVNGVTFDVRATFNQVNTNDQVQLNIFNIESQTQIVTQKGLFMALAAVNNASGSGYAWCDVMSV